MSDIVPEYVRRRVRVAAIFRHYMDDADWLGNSALYAVLEALSAEILDALDPEISGGGQ